MAYVTGSTTNPTNLLDAVRTTLLSLGWTVNYWGADAYSGSSDANRGNATMNQWLSLLSPDGAYFNLISDLGRGSVWAGGATGYSGSSNHNSIPGKSTWAETNGLGGPYTAYYIFATTTYCHVVVERSTNQFAHFQIGRLEKAGTYTGGEYVHQTLWDYGNTSRQNNPDDNNSCLPFDSFGQSGYLGAAVRMDIDGASNNWINYYGADPAHCAGTMRKQSLGRHLWERTPNTMNGMTPLIPSIIVGPRPAGGNAILGTVPDVRGVNMTLLAPKQLITLGSDDWMVFPVIRKGTGTIYEAVSGIYGIAYRKVA